MNQPLQPAQIHSSLTVLVVSNLEKAQAYYQDVLGCEVTDFWVIRDGLHGLGLKLLQAECSEEVKPNSMEDKVIWDIYAYAEDFASLDQLYQEFLAKGAVVVSEPTVEAQDWGAWKEFAIRDLDGYVIGFGAADKSK